MVLAPIGRAGHGFRFNRTFISTCILIHLVEKVNTEEEDTATKAHLCGGSSSVVLEGWGFHGHSVCTP